jgi:hypothetical protein
MTGMSRTCCAQSPQGDKAGVILRNRIELSLRDAAHPHRGSALVQPEED